MPLRRLIALVVFVTVLGTAGTARAAANDAALFINQLGSQAIDTLRATNLTLDQREARFRSLLSQSFDLRFIGRFVLGRYWRGATPDQQNDYIVLYGEFLLQTYSARLGGYSGQTLTVIGALPKPVAAAGLRSIWSPHEFPAFPKPRSAAHE